MTTEELHRTLENDGVVRIPNLIPPDALKSMQVAFAARLQRLRWNDVDGYEKTEPYRHMIQNVLTLEQGFVDVALHPVVVELSRAYLGDAFQLVEAKGWRSLATQRGFHGWHGDAWYDQNSVGEVPRELKMALYLTDVTSGEFQYVRGSHQKQHPRVVPDREVGPVGEEQMVRMLGPAGSVFMFDTTGIHRQGEPILEDRHACFYCYHDPSIPLQEEDVAYNRYHPLLLNAAFLGDLSAEEGRILGFGDRRTFVPEFQRHPRFAIQERLQRRWLDLHVRFDEFWSRVRARLGRA